MKAKEFVLLVLLFIVCALFSLLTSCIKDINAYPANNNQIIGTWANDDITYIFADTDYSIVLPEFNETRMGSYKWSNNTLYLNYLNVDYTYYAEVIGDTLKLGYNNNTKSYAKLIRIKK